MEETVRVRVPKGKEVIGVIEEVLPGSKARVRCGDGKMRICRVPGRCKRRIWLKPNIHVLVKPWDTQSDTRGDLIWSYKKSRVKWLRKKGYLKELR